MLTVIFTVSAFLTWAKSSYADPQWGHHGQHSYYRYHDHPHYGAHVDHFYRNEYFPVKVGGVPYYYDDGIYYGYSGGVYVVAAPPVGAVVSSVPSDFHPVVINGVTYYADNGTYYVATPGGYEVVSPPR